MIGYDCVGVHAAESAQSQQGGAARLRIAVFKQTHQGSFGVARLRQMQELLPALFLAPSPCIGVVFGPAVGHSAIVFDKQSGAHVAPHWLEREKLRQRTADVPALSFRRRTSLYISPCRGSCLPAPGFVSL